MAFKIFGIVWLVLMLIVFLDGGINSLGDLVITGIALAITIGVAAVFILDDGAKSEYRGKRS